MHKLALVYLLQIGVRGKHYAIIIMGRAAEMCKPKWCCITRPENARNRGHTVVGDQVRRGHGATECNRCDGIISEHIETVNALKTRLDRHS